VTGSLPDHPDSGAPGPSRPAPPQLPFQRPSLAQQVRRSPATAGLVGVTVCVFALQQLSTLLAGTDWVTLWGAKVNAAIAAGQIWRLVTPLLLHAGLLHLFVNMYSLVAIGPAVERLFGSRRMLAVYILAGVVGVEFSLAFSPYASVGASGAIFGLLGALAAFLYIHRRTLGPSGQITLRRIIFVALLNLGLGLAPGIDNWGHLGGLLSGVAMGGYLGPRLEPIGMDLGRLHLVDRRPWDQVRRRLWVAVAVVAVLAALAMTSPLGG
jgi:rhomboid protease GluP